MECEPFEKVSVYIPRDIFKKLQNDKNLWTDAEKYRHDIDPKKVPAKSALVVRAISRYYRSKVRK